MAVLVSLVEPMGLEAALIGLAGVDEAWELPKKSSPSKESPGFCFGAAVTAVALTAGRAEVVSAVLGLTGGMGLSSPKRSMLGVGRCEGCGG